MNSLNVEQIQEIILTDIRSSFSTGSRIMNRDSMRWDTKQ